MWQRRRLSSCGGQALVEFAVVLPLLLLVACGVVEIAYALLDQHVVTRLAREGSNLISRNTSVSDAVTALSTMSTRPVDFTSRSRVIFSVLKKGATTGTSNYDRIFLYQRHEHGSLSAGSKLATRGSGSFGGSPDYRATNSDNAAGLQVTYVSPDLIMARGGMIYVTEIFTTHELLTPLAAWGIDVPPTLYSIAYF